MLIELVIQFYNMDQKALSIHMVSNDVSNSILIKNCTFKNITHAAEVLHSMIMSNNKATIQFENCEFYNNSASTIILYTEYFDTNMSTFMIMNCNFSDNNGTLLKLSTREDCKPKIFFHESVTVARNEGEYIMHFTHLAVYMSGIVTILKNIAMHKIIVFDICNVTFSKTITFISNRCYSAVHLKSHELPYIVISDYTNIMLINNKIDGEVIAYEITGYYYYIAFPYCIFQYKISTDHKWKIDKLIKFYNISFSGNNSHKQASIYSLDVQMNNIYDLLTHCKWLHTAVFNGSNPEYINQQIV